MENVEAFHSTVRTFGNSLKMTVDLLNLIDDLFWYNEERNERTIHLWITRVYHRWDNILGTLHDLFDGTPNIKLRLSNNHSNNLYFSDMLYFFSYV